MTAAITTIEPDLEQLLAGVERALKTPLVIPVRRPLPASPKTLLPASLPDFTPGRDTYPSRWGRE